MNPNELNAAIAPRVPPFPQGWFPSQFEWCRSNGTARKLLKGYGPWSCGKDNHASHCGIVTCKRVHGVPQTTAGQAPTKGDK